MDSGSSGTISSNTQNSCFDRKPMIQVAVAGLGTVAFLAGVTALVMGLLGHFGVMHGLSSVVSYVLIGIGSGGIGASLIGYMILSVISSYKAKPDGSRDTDHEGTGFFESMFSSKKGIDSETELPAWLADCLDSDVPRLPTPSARNSFAYFINAMQDHTICLFDAKLCMKLEVTHENHNPEYTHSRRELITPDMSSSKNPFFIYVMVWVGNPDGSWCLTSDPDDWIEHRNGAICVDRILGDNRYRFRASDAFDLEQSAEFKSIESQDEDALKENRFDLRWLLVRLLNGENVKVREARGLVTSFDDPAVGYWNIHLASETL